jgi:hypothetical protein
MLGLGAPSQCVVGIHAATLQDCWTTAYYIASVAGGDPGCPGLFGEMDLGSGRKLERVIRLDTLGWEETEPATREKFEVFLRRLEGFGVTVLSRRDDARIEDFERALRCIPEFMWPIFLWEMRWPGWLARDRGAHLISDIVLGRLKRAEAMSIGEYRQAIMRRQALQGSFLVLSELAGRSRDPLQSRACSDWDIGRKSGVCRYFFKSLMSILRVAIAGSRRLAAGGTIGWIPKSGFQACSVCTLAFGCLSRPVL